MLKSTDITLLPATKHRKYDTKNKGTNGIQNVYEIEDSRDEHDYMRGKRIG